MSKIDDVLRKLDTLDERTKNHYDQYQLDQANTVKRLDSHAEKIRSLEHFRNWATGIGAAIAGLLGLKSGHS